MGVVGVVILRMDVGAKGREEWAHLNTGEKGIRCPEYLAFSSLSSILILMATIVGHIVFCEQIFPCSTS